MPPWILVLHGNTGNSDHIISGMMNGQLVFCHWRMELVECAGCVQKILQNLQREIEHVLEMIGVYTLHVDHERLYNDPCSSNLGNWFSFT